MARTKNPNGRKRKKTLYMPDNLIEPLETEAKRIDRTVSWVVSECVRSAMPMFEARRLCPEAVVVAPDMAKYASVGREVRSRMLELVKPVFDGKVIANGGIEPATANELISQGAVDAVSFGRLWMANPDLLERIRRGGPYAKAITRRFYGGGADGYNDYPTLDQQQLHQGT